MKDWNLLGKNCRDIVTGYEGICISVVEWIYGCQQYRLQAKSEKPGERLKTDYFFEKQLEIIDDGITEKVEIPEYDEPKFFGKECVDKVTGFKGMCVGRVIWLFSTTQYIVEFQPEDQTKDGKIQWLDEGRIELAKAPKKEVDPEEVRSPRQGGVTDPSEFPQRMFMPEMA